MTTAIAQQRRPGLTAALAAKFEMEPGVFLDTIKKTVMPSQATNEEVCSFLMVAKEYDLNPLLREIHAYPKKGGGIQTVVGVDGWAKIITRHKDFDGVEFSYERDENGNPFSITCSIYRKNCSRPTSVTEFYSECRRNTDPWNNMANRMLRHKALIQCGRIAFGISGIMDEDEARDVLEVTATVVDEPKPSEKANNMRSRLADKRKKATKPKQEEAPAPAPEVSEEEAARVEEKKAEIAAALAEDEAPAEPEDNITARLDYIAKAKEIDAALAGKYMKRRAPVAIAQSDKWFNDFKENFEADLEGDTNE